MAISRFKHSVRELVTLNAAHAAMMASVNAGLVYDVVKLAWVNPEDLTIKPEPKSLGTPEQIRKALAVRAITGKSADLLTGKFATAFDKIEARGGIEAISADIAARIEAARKQCG